MEQDEGAEADLGPPEEKVLLDTKLQLLNKIFKLLDFRNLKTCRGVCKRWEIEATNILVTDRNLVICPQSIQACCTSNDGPLLNLHNPLLATRVKMYDKCRHGNHSDLEAFSASCSTFLAFCAQYNQSIREIYFDTPSEQRPSRQRTPPFSSSIAVYSQPLLTNLRYVEVCKTPDFRSRAIRKWMESVVQSSPNLTHLRICDYMYPSFVESRYNFPFLRKLKIELCPYKLNCNYRQVKHNLFSLCDIRRIISELRYSIESLVLISTAPVIYRNDLNWNGLNDSGFFLDPTPNDALLPPILPRLKFLKIHHSEYFVLTPLELAIRKLPKLETLEISSSTDHIGQPVSLFFNEFFVGKTGHSAGLSTLKLEGVDTVRVFSQISTKFPNLKTLCLKMTNPGIFFTWTDKELFIAISKMKNLQHLQVHLSRPVIIPDFTIMLGNVQDIWQIKNINHSNHANFLGLMTCRIIMSETSGDSYEELNFDRFKHFLLAVSRGMQRFEFSNFTGSYAKAFSLGVFIYKNSLPVFFTDIQEEDAN